MEQYQRPHGWQLEVCHLFQWDQVFIINSVSSLMIPLIRMPSSEILCFFLEGMLSLMTYYLPTYLISLETTLPTNPQKNH